MYCNNCGCPNPGEQPVCGACGTPMSPEPHISDVTSGNVVICGTCGGANIKDSTYCRVCGRSLSPVKISASVVNEVSVTSAANDNFTAEYPAAYEASPPPAEVPALLVVSPEPRNILLEKLDALERELEAKKQEAPPEPERHADADKLDEYEETLKNIAFTLDTLISDLLKAEAEEYASAESPRADGKSFAKNGAGAKRDPLKKKDRSFQDVVVLLLMLALIAAIFLVGMTFGLWGSYFFGI